MSKETIRLPDVGSSDPVDIIEVSVKKGDTIAAEDTIIVLESDKASLEVPAPKGGKVLDVLIKEGDRVKEGDPLLELEVEGEGGGDASDDDDDQGDADEQAGAAADEDQDDSEVDGDDQDDDDEDEDQDDDEDEAASGGIQEVTVPDLGDIDEAEIIEVSVSEGDRVEVEQTIIVVESDKASLEIPAPAAGIVKALKVKAGDKVGTGDPLMDLETQGGGGGKSKKPKQGSAGKENSSGDGKGTGEGGDKVSKGASSSDRKEKAGQSDKGGNPQDSDRRPVSESRQEGQPSESVHAGPAVRKLARETGVDLARVTPTGPKDRVLKDDVHAYIKQRMESPAAGGGAAAADLPEIDFSEFGPVERQELNKLRKVAARNLHRAWVTIPHVTQFDEADITELEAFRKSQNKLLEKEGVKLTMLAFLVKACASALREFPRVNSSLEVSGEALIMKDYVHIGIAVDTPNGLVVPVLRDADKKGLKQIAKEVGELAAKARDRKLSPADMKGATFSISSLGGIGGTAFTPIVNWPEVAILGVSRTDTKPVWDGNAFQPRLTLPLSLSYDHRVIDGADAARFTTYLSQWLGDMRRALL